MNLTESIKEAFFYRNSFIVYYNLLNEFFLEDRLRVIHDAKTIAVAIRCVNLHQTLGFSYTCLYEHIEGLFTTPSSLRLSDLIDLSSCKSFEGSIEELQEQYGTSRRRVEILLGLNDNLVPKELSL